MAHFPAAELGSAVDDIKLTPTSAKQPARTAPSARHSHASTHIAAARGENRGVGALASVMAVFLIFLVGRPEDIIPGLDALPVVKIVAALAIIAAVQTRTTLAPIKLWSLPPVKYTLLIMILITVSILFSVLHHNTLNVIKGMMLATTVGTILLVKAAHNWWSIRRLLFALVISAVVLAVSAEMTRFYGRAGYTRNMDPNDFAFVFDGLLPIILTFALVSRGTRRLGFLIIAVWVVLEILKTESRGGLLGLTFATAAMVVLLPRYHRGTFTALPTKSVITARLLALSIASFLVWHAIPESARARLATVTSIHSCDSGKCSSADYNMNLHDPTGRLAIWTQTLPLSLQRPWGWGAGTFATVDGRFGGGRYMVAHNMYLQTLIELGFPGLFLFLATLGSCYRGLRRNSAPPDSADQAQLENCAFARAMIASLIGLCISGFFLAELYRQALWMLIILATLVGQRKPADTPANSPATAG